MNNAKKGLRLLSLSIILNIIWSIIAAILPGVVGPDSSSEAVAWIIANILLITAIVSLVCYVIDLIGLHIAGKDNARFHLASKLKFITIGLAVVCIILGAVALANPSAAQGLATANSVINIIASVAEVVVLLSIIKGCKEIAPRVSGLSNVVLVTFTLMLLLTIIMSFLMAGSTSIEDPKIIAAGIFGIIVAIDALVYAICYIILIFRTTANVGK